MRGVAAVAATAALCVELYPGDVRQLFLPLPATPKSAQWLAASPRGPVLELPWDEEHPEWGGRYLYWSTLHWHPMVNGWGGFSPVGATALGTTGRHFPVGPTVRELRAAGVRYVVVHLDRVRPRQRQMLTSGEALPPGLRLAADFGEERVYEIDRERPGAEALVGHSRIAGAPRTRYDGRSASRPGADRAPRHPHWRVFGTDVA